MSGSTDVHAHGGFAHAHPHRGRHRHLSHPHASSRRGTVLDDPVYRRLLAAQVISLAGTGVTTVALGLLAYDLAGANAGAVLGAALALKMVAYVGLPPVTAAFAHRVDRRRLLIALDLIRFGVLLLLPFVDAIWQVMALILVVNACAAGFTPAFQATLPDVLPDERDYTRALSFSRVAYDLADLLSPVAAAGLLVVMRYHGLFVVDAASFLVSAALLVSIRLPEPEAGRRVSERTRARITAGARRFAQVPRLRGLLALNLAAAAGSAMVIVNTVVLVRSDLHLGGTQVALALAASGVGSVATAFAVPGLLRRATDRTVMLSGAALLAGSLLVTAAVDGYAALLAVWVVVGAGLALVQTPIGRLLQRSADPADRPPLFAAQFALSHLCWLATYPIAGVLGAAVGVSTVSVVLATITAVSVVAAAVLWPAAGEAVDDA
ncbi:MAG: MFS transporter [Patulibacter sp.]|nr:MFS transporter [Patulibacter sp.]